MAKLDTSKINEFIEIISPLLRENETHVQESCEKQKPLPFYFRNDDFHKALSELNILTKMMVEDEDNDFVVKTEFENEERVKEKGIEFILRTKKVIPGKPKKPETWSTKSMQARA